MTFEKKFYRMTLYHFFPQIDQAEDYGIVSAQFNTFICFIWMGQLQWANLSWYYMTIIDLTYNKST